MSWVTIRPGEIKVIPMDAERDENKGIAIVRNFGKYQACLALIHPFRKRRRLRIFIFNEDEEFELRWRKIRLKDLMSNGKDGEKEVKK